MPAKGTETILVVEDQVEVRAVISATLRRHGYTVLDAGIGADAIAVASEHQGHIHLLITDVVLPEMDGLLSALLKATEDA
jgi:CheY-like chemotaxis protein